MDEHSIKRGRIMRPTRLHQHLSSFVIAALLGGVAPVMAAEFTDGVPQALVKALLLNPLGEDMRLIDGIPEAFPDISIPGDFTVLGGLEQGPSQRVVLQSSFSPDDAMVSMTEAIVSAGFVDMEALTRQQRTGFLPAQSGYETRLLCRNGFGTMNVEVSSPEGVTQVVLGTTGFERLGFASCEEMAGMSSTPPSGWISSDRPRALFVELATNFGQHMPVMELPADAETARGVYFGSSRMSSSRDTHETSSQFASAMTIPQLYEHFAAQIAAQGWALDGASTGQVSASSNWIKIPEADTYLHGAFSLLQNSESNFTLNFKMTKLDAGQ